MACFGDSADAFSRHRHVSVLGGNFAGAPPKRRTPPVPAFESQVHKHGLNGGAEAFVPFRLFAFSVSFSHSHCNLIVNYLVYVIMSGKLSP